MKQYFVFNKILTSTNLWLFIQQISLIRPVRHTSTRTYRKLTHTTNECVRRIYEFQNLLQPQITLLFIYSTFAMMAASMSTYVYVGICLFSNYRPKYILVLYEYFNCRYFSYRQILKLVG